MPVTNPWKSYRQIATQTATPGQLILMLYEGALRSMERALPGYSCEDPGQANSLIFKNLQHAQEIIRELNRALNMEQGGECALTLRRLYNYFDKRLTEGCMHHRRESVEEVIRHLSIIRDAWAEMLANSAVISMPVPTVIPACMTA